MTPITDKINQLPDGEKRGTVKQRLQREIRELKDANRRLAAELERKTRALEHYADLCHWKNADLTILRPDFIANEYDFDRNGWEIAQAALKG